MTALSTGAIELSPLEKVYATLSPCVFRPSLAVAYLGGASSAELRARVGRVPEARGGTIWLHGASAGEMAGGVRLIEALRNHGYCFPAVFTAANRAGVAYVSRWADRDTIAALAPWDVLPWLKRAFDRWQPAALFLIETEMWPLLVFEAHRRGVPVITLSGRIYPRDVARYRAIRPLIAPTLRRLCRILAQNETERDRFIALGADADRCVVAGNLKYLQQRVAGDLAALRAQLGVSATTRLIVFGSAHDRELAFIFDAITALRGQDFHFAVAPRHLSSVPRLLREAAERGLKAVLRSRVHPGEDWEVLGLDTMGELRDLYTLASLAVICGGFGRFGGHNPLEAIEGGAPVLFGPHFDHFQYEAGALMAVTPEAVVSSPQQLAARIRSWAGDEQCRQGVISVQRQAMPDADTITRRYLDELAPYLAAVHA